MDRYHEGRFDRVVCDACGQPAARHERDLYLCDACDVVDVTDPVCARCGLVSWEPLDDDRECMSCAQISAAEGGRDG